MESLDVVSWAGIAKPPCRKRNKKLLVGFQEAGEVRYCVKAVQGLIDRGFTRVTRVIVCEFRKFRFEGDSSCLISSHTSI